MRTQLISSYSEVSAQWTFRVSFGIMAAMTLWLGTPFLQKPDVQLTRSLLPILQDRLLFHRPRPIQEERQSKPIRLRFRNSQTRLDSFHRSSNRNNNRMAI
jgi:hypothetical protein